MRAVPLVLVCIGCASDPEQHPGDIVISKVTVRDIPIASGQMLSVASLCFDEAPLPEPYDCSVTLVEADAQHIVPSCNASPDARPCWRIVVDRQNCFDAAFQKLEIVRAQPPAYVHHLVIQCVTY